MKLRYAEPSDAMSIAALHAASWQSAYALLLSHAYLEHQVPVERKAVWLQRMASPRPNQYVIVAEYNGQLVGFACVFVAECPRGGSYLENLHVSALCQRQGVGTALLVRVAQVCESGAPGQGLYLSVNQENRRAQQFYSRLGAQNAEAGVWNAPDGSVVPTYRFVWSSLAPLAAKL